MLSSTPNNNVRGITSAALHIAPGETAFHVGMIVVADTIIHWCMLVFKGTSAISLSHKHMPAYQLRHVTFKIVRKM